MIYEVIVTTTNADGRLHVAPMGIRRDDHTVYISPFKPSTTLANLIETETAVINYTDDVRVFAGCLTGRHDWSVTAAKKVKGLRLDACLAHEELRVSHIEAHELRPRVHCEVVYRETHQAFSGFNRAQAAVIEGAVLTSRLDMLPMEKIETEFEYLKIAIDKTAGPRELEAWSWLMDKLQSWREAQSSTKPSNQASSS